MNPRRWMRALFFALLGAGLITACTQHNNDSNSRVGNVRVMLTAAPAVTATAVPAAMTGTSGGMSMSYDEDGGDILSMLSQVNVTFSSLLARNLDGDLVKMAIDLPQTVDLIGLINGKQVMLPPGTLPAGMYDQIVVVIKQVEFVFVDGTKKTLTPPGGGWTRIIPVETFEVIDGQTTTINLRFNPLHAFDESGGEFHFSPDFDCERED